MDRMKWIYGENGMRLGIGSIWASKQVTFNRWPLASVELNPFGNLKR